MSVKTRAQLKAENSADFPDNIARLISPADLRGQMDDIVDSLFLAEDLDTPGGPVSDSGATGPMGPPGPPGPPGTGEGTATYYVPDIATMRAIPELAAGTVIFVGEAMDQFVVVDDPSIATDGGTVFIPDDQLSETFEEVIPVTAFDGSDVFAEYALDHAGIDFDSFELVVSDPNALFPAEGEIIDIWTIMHGHVMSPGVMPHVIPKLKTAEGKFLDPYAKLTKQALAPPAHPPVRTGGVLARYKYATSGLRLKRVTGPVFRLDWWPVVAIDEEAPGVQTDNSGKICWCINAAMAAGAEAIFIPKMYYYRSVVELPDDIEIRGLGPGRSGFKVMDNTANDQLLLTTSSDGAAANPALDPLVKPSTRAWVYHGTFLSNVPTFFPMNGAMHIRIKDIEIDGNVANNMRFFTQQNAEYAYTFAQNQYFFNAITYSGFTITNHGARVISPGMTIELSGHVKIHGHYGHTMLGNVNARFIQNGMLELGNSLCGHVMYQCQGEYEHIKITGPWSTDCIRCEKFVARSIEVFGAPYPAVMYDLPGGDAYSVSSMSLSVMSTNEAPQGQHNTHNFPYPLASPTRVVVEHLFVDATGQDNLPAGKPYVSVAIMSLAADNIYVRSGRIRYGSGNTTVASLFLPGANTPLGLPPRNIVIENLQAEHGSRSGVQFFRGGGIEGGFAQANFRNISFEPRAMTHMPGNPMPGTAYMLGAWSFTEPIPPASGAYDGYDFEFGAVTVDATLNGKYIDITPADPSAPMYRLWFNYNSLGSAPAAGGGTLVPVAVAAGATTAAVAAAFSAAIGGTMASPGVPSGYLTAATFKTVSAIGSFSRYHADPDYGLITYSLSAAAGITAASRAYRRNYEPSIIGFERFVAADPTYVALMMLNTIGPHRDIYFRFKECVLGSWNTSYPTVNGAGGLQIAAVNAIKDQVRWVFEDTILDCRDGSTWQNLDLFLYASKFRNCRVRTPQVSTGLTTMATTGYDTLFSEDSGVYTGTPGAGVTTVDIQTKLFWVPKEGNVRIYPADAATAVVWNTNMPSVSWMKSARPISSTYTALGGSGAYYQGPAGINEDRRAPALRLTFATAPATALAIGWSAAVSP